jgi:putative transposase
MRRKVIDDFQISYQVSVRKICQLFNFSKSSYYYQAVIDHQAIVIKQKVRDIAASRVRYGYRRIHILLRREGRIINHKKVYRLYCELNLQLRNKTPKRRVQAVVRVTSSKLF